tara:strand:- start:257 stop:418 length:162 start_codon:yes stop_codon:yes gene_type:complete
MRFEFDAEGGRVRLVGVFDRSNFVMCAKITYFDNGTAILLDPSLLQGTAGMQA